MQRFGIAGRTCLYIVLGVPTAKTSETNHIQRHKDGSVWAIGKLRGGIPSGYWEWFRKDGTKLRSGSFEKGEQIGEWTTYDRKGEVYKVTLFKSKRSRSQ